MLNQGILQLHGTDFFSISEMPVSVFRIAAENDLRHSHDFCEMVLVSGGTAQHELFAPKCDVPALIPLAHGCLFFVPLGWSHCYRQTERFEIYNVLFDAQLIERWPQSATPSVLGDGAFDVPLMWSLQRGDYEHLETLLRTIMRELTGRQRSFELAAQAKLAEVLVWVDRLSLHRREKRSAESQLALSKAVAFMEQNFAEPISLEDIARTAHLSPHYFCEVFKGANGVSPGRYLTRLRLEHARYLLLTTTSSITQVARESGFGDASYFARAFKTAFGTAPTRLRSTGR